MPPRKSRTSAAAKAHEEAVPQQTVEVTETMVAKPNAVGRKSKAARHQPLLVETSQPHDAEAGPSETTESTPTKPSLQDRQAKLARLRTKMAATTKANRKDILQEQSRSRTLAADGKKPSSRKLAKAEQVLEERDLAESGEDVERYRNMLYSVEDSERWDAKLANKEARKDQGQIDFQDAAERSYQRQVQQLKPDLAAYRQQRDTIVNQHASSPALATSSSLSRKANTGNMVTPHLDQFGEVDSLHYGSHTPTDDAIDRVVTHLNHQQQIINTRSRKRPQDQSDSADITYINDRNKHFNNKLKRFFDSKTKQVRENLERGTAL